jgi:hypothetical protein
MRCALLPALFGILLSSCGSSALRAELFSVDFIGAEYPVMLSHAPTCAGRPVAGKSGEYAKNSQQSWERRWNVVGASEQVTQQLDRDARCVQIDRVVFSARTERAWVRAEQDAELTINGSAAP